MVLGASVALLLAASFWRCRIDAASVERPLAAPAAINKAAAVTPAADTSWYGTTHHGPEFVSVRDFGARGDNVTDDTVAIQKAINWGRLQTPVAKHPPTLGGRPYAPARRAIVYLPPGRYVVADTLVLPYFTQLRGSTVEPPTLVLRASSQGFAGPALKPIIATAGGSNQSTPWWRDGFHANDMFYLEIQSLAIEVGPSNDGAVGIFWNVAQQTSLRDITIRDAAVGIDVSVTDGYVTPQHSSAGVGGGGTIEDITIVGGRVGMRLAGSQFAMRGLHFKGQNETAMHTNSAVWTFGFATVDASDTPALLTVDGHTGNNQLNNIVLLDVTLANITGPSAIVLPADGIPLLLENLSYTGTAEPPAATVTAGASVWLNASRSVGRWAGWAGQNQNGTLANGIVVGSELLTSSRISLPSQRVQALPSRPRPWFDELQRTEICNAVTDCDAKGNNRTDDTAKLQACVRRCTAVFLPSGVYMISDTLLLRHNSVLVGEALSQIFLGSGSAGFGDPTVPKPVVDTPDDVGGSVRVTEITIQTGGGNRGAVLLRWRVGPASGLWDVHLNISSNVSDKRSVQRFDLTLSVLHACSGKRVCDSLICWTLR
jgi:glucan 1,3-beta-glucosidase